MLLNPNNCQFYPHLGALVIAMGKDRDVGSCFEREVDATGPREEVPVGEIKAVIACQLAEEMKKKKLSKRRMAKMMNTSRTQITRLLDPENGNVTIESLQRAARIVERELRMELVQENLPLMA